MSNSGVIGDKQTPSTSSAGGVHTSQEVYTHLTDGTFPTPYHITMTGIPSTIDEDSAFTVSVSDSSGATYSLPYLLDDNTYGNIEPADFQSAVTGNISMVAGVGTLVVTLDNDGVTENEHFRIVTKHPVTDAYNFISGQIDITDTAGSGYRYFRLNDLVPYSSSRKPRLTDFRLYTGTGLSGTSYPSNMTSASTPSPYVVTESSYYYTDYGWYAMDSSLYTRWQLINTTTPSTYYLTIDMGTSLALQSVAFRWSSNSYRCTSLTLSGSSDNSNWTTLLTVSGISSYLHNHDF